MDLESRRAELVAIVKAHGLMSFDAPVRLASGEMSHDYVDGKRAFAHGARLEAACRAILELTRSQGIEFDAVGGLTMGADQFAHVLAVMADVEWFVVRKQVKDHGTGRRVEGARLGPGLRALVVEDVVTTGASLLDAVAVVAGTGAQVVQAVTVIDRGDVASAELERRQLPYSALLTYRDLGIRPVGASAGG